jgi:DNA adenine methylase
MQKTKAKPFLKWAGGKGQLISQFQKFYPEELKAGKIQKYIEPFVGGGAVLFDVMQNFEVKSALIADINPDLIITYKVIQRMPEALCDLLEEMQNEYGTASLDAQKAIFQKIRKLYNESRLGFEYEKLSEKWIIRAAQLIFLNKTCYNGLFRTNSKGAFNVPFGKYDNPRIYDGQNIYAVSSLLQNIEIRQTNYYDCYDLITQDSFVYFDPPYKPISKTASFTAYSATSFTDEDQIALATFYRKLDIEKHAKLMLSNSDPKNENPSDRFFAEQYDGFNMHSVSALRAINSDSEKRGKISELVITNYPVKMDF